MASFNRIQIGGYLAKDIQVSQTPNGKTVGKTSIATNRKFGEKESTTWFNLTIWGERATALEQYLTKGQQVFVAGELEMTSYTDRDGNQRNSLEVNVSDVQLMGSKGDGQAKAKAATAGAEASTTTDDSDETIPF